MAVSSWIPRSEAEDTIKKDSYAEDDNERQATTMTDDTVATEKYVSAKTRSDEMEDFLDTKSRDKALLGSITVLGQASNETQNIPESSPLTSESSSYRMPGLFGLNGGEPFYLEKDPITGAVDFSTKTSAVKIEENEDVDAEGPSLKNHKISEPPSASDYYYYDDEVEDSDNIDRRDGAFNDNVRTNYMTPYKDYPLTINAVNIHAEDHSNHKYQPHQSNKYPLISSSYANTKIQGTGAGINRNHRPHATSSTQSPFYYTIRPQPTFLTSTPQPPPQGTIKYKVFQNNNSPHPLTSEEITYYKPNTEKHNTPLLNSQEDRKQAQQENHQETLIEKQDQNQDYESHDGKQQQIELHKQAQQDKKHALQPSDHSSASATNPKVPTQILPVKSSQQPFNYEEINNEDYDTEAPTTFSLAELFGYGRPPTKTEEKKSQQEERQHEEENSMKGEHKKPLLFTSQPAHTSTTSSQSIVYQESNSEVQNYITDKIQEKLHTTQKPIINKSSTTQHLGIIYSQPSTVKQQNTGSSNPPDIKSPNKRPEKYQPSLNIHSDTYNQETSKIALPNLASIPSKNVKTNLGTLQSVNQQEKPGYSMGSGQFEINAVQNNPYGSYAEEPFRPIFGPGQADNRPPLSQPEHLPLMATSNKDRNINSMSDRNISQAQTENVGSSKIPHETPSRWNYPYTEGTSTFFRLPPSHNQQQQNIVSAENPARIPVFEPQRPHSENLSFINIHSQQHKPTYISETSVSVGSFAQNHSRVQSNDLQKPSISQVPGVFKPEWTDSNANRKGDEGYVVFPDSNSEEARPQDENLKRLSIAVAVSTDIKSIANEEDNYQPLPPQSQLHQEEIGSSEIPHTSSQQEFPHSVHRPTNQNGPPIPHRKTVKEPAQELQPPAEPEILRKQSVSGSYTRPQWESRPTIQHQYFPQLDPSQIARPKHDAIPPHFGQNSPNFGTGYRIRPGFSSEHPFQGNQGPPITKNRNHDPNLPNILPQFRPNARIAHVHPENEGRIQSYVHFGPQRQPLLERPSRRPSPEFMGHLHPPPPPNHKRVNRNDNPGPLDGLNKPEEIVPFGKYPPQSPTIAQRPLVHRINGPHITNVGGSQPQVATLQMMQHQQIGASTRFLPRPHAARDDFPDSNDQIKPPFEVKYPLGSVLDSEASEKQPVFVVYPVNSTPLNTGSESSNNGGVVVGSRGPQRPLPPSNFDSGLSLSSEDGGSLTLPFPGHKNQKPVLQLPTDRFDSFQLQSQNPNSATQSINVEQPIKSEFPYPLERPDAFTDIVEGEIKEESERHKEMMSILAGGAPSNNDKYDSEIPLTSNGIQAENPKGNNDRHNDDDTDINIIPYLQDYMPFATKKPIISTKPSPEINLTTFASISPPLGPSTSSIRPENDVFHGNQWATISDGHQIQDARIVNTEGSENEVHGSTSSTSKSHYSPPISVVLKTVRPQSSTTHSPVSQPTLSVTSYPKAAPLSATSATVYGGSPQPAHQQGLVGSAGSEFTVSAVMHTHPQAPNNHRPAELFSSTSPPQLNFQAPFLASANIEAAPTNQGWSVVGSEVTSNGRMKPGTVDKADLHEEELEASEINTTTDNQSSEPSNFDFENFRPQLFGGFKPIYTFPEDSGEEHSKYLQTTERQEKMIS